MENTFIHMSLQERTLYNVNQFLDQQGFKKSRLAKRMGMSPANFYDYLANKRQGVLEFAAQLAETLGYSADFFMGSEFQLSVETETTRAIAFSSGEQLSPVGQQGFSQLLRICDLFEIYSLEEKKCQS